jgi:hypothetical protein
LSALLTSFFASFRIRVALQFEILALRHQLGILQPNFVTERIDFAILRASTPEVIAYAGPPSENPM